MPKKKEYQTKLEIVPDKADETALEYFNKEVRELDKKERPKKESKVIVWNRIPSVESKKLIKLQNKANKARNIYGDEVYIHTKMVGGKSAKAVMLLTALISAFHHADIIRLTHRDFEYLIPSKASYHRALDIIKELPFITYLVPPDGNQVALQFNCDIYEGYYEAYKTPWRKFNWNK